MALDAAFRRSTKAAFDHHTLLWWVGLSSISLIVIAVWIYSYATLLHQTTSVNDGHPYQRYHLMLSGVYVFVCVYRSFLPRIDLERYCLWDTFASSIFFGRSTATIAEVAFAGQIALFLYDLGQVHDHPFARCLTIVLVPMIITAQCFCWCDVVTLNHVYHAIEESICAISSLLVGAEMASLAIYHSDSQPVYALGIIGSILCFSFLGFMVIVDVPMYTKRWREGRIKMDRERKLIYMDSFEGAEDVLRTMVVTKSWDVWKEETVWLTGYFSSAVWLSFLLVHMPAPV
ncbi:hypothetical protein ACHAWF_013458 [Thalassiosira exigua]